MDFGLHNSITKRQRFLGDISGFNEDRISNLPDGVLSLVLSFLPTKSAVGTTILSKRWNYLWTSVKNLDFDSSSVVYRSSYVSYDEFLNSFVKFVERVLFFHDGRSVDKFCLSSSSGVCAIQFYTWVSAVVPCHLKELEVNSPRIRHTDMLSTKFWQVDMPWSLFTCKTLTTLKLSGGSVLNLPTRVCLPVLKILHLSSVIYVDDASIQKLISGCPVLEDLDIERHEWDGVRVINITSPTLKRFSMQFFLYGYIERCSYKISVSAPSLVYLKLADNMAVEYSLYDMPSLVEAQIGIYNDDSSRSLELLEEVTHVRVLQLSGKILEFIESDEDYEIPMFHNVARLELGANKQAGWDLLAELLESTPNLEVLVFPRGLVKRRSGKKPYFEFGCVKQSRILELFILIQFSWILACKNLSPNDRGFLRISAGTTILSKRWNNLLTSAKNLDFDSSLILNINRSYFASSDEFMRSFVEFVERVLFFHDGMSIDKFRILSRSRVCDNHIYTWVSAVVPCHLKELQASTSVCQTDNPSVEMWQVDLPSSLFTCKTLTTLNLSGEFVLHLPTCVCLPVLKILHLNSVIYVDDVSIKMLISGCPVLEDLDIERHNWDGVQVIDIYSTTLKRFSMQFFLYDHVERCSNKISVSAPNLVYLKLADNMAVKYSVSNIPSLVEAQIGIYNYNSPHSLELVKEVTHVKVLQLSGKILEVAT
ncbi:hypothetical protein AgCh_029127 [Apium graveolens]